MKLLLDTHSFIWFVEGNPALSPHARTLIEEPTNEVFLSMASVWEIDLIKIYDVSNGPLRQYSRVNMMKPCRQVER